MPPKESIKEKMKINSNNKCCELCDKFESSAGSARVSNYVQGCRNKDCPCHKPEQKCNCQFEEGHSRVCPLFVEKPFPSHQPLEKLDECKNKIHGGCICHPHKYCKELDTPKTEELSDWENEILELSDLSFGSRFVGEHSKQFSNYEVRVIKFIKSLLSQTATEHYQKGYDERGIVDGRTLKVVMDKLSKYET